MDNIKVTLEDLDNMVNEINELAEPLKQYVGEKVRTCRVCGKQGTGMIANLYYIGGQGDVLLWECKECLDAKWEASSKDCEKLRESMRQSRNDAIYDAMKDQLAEHEANL